MEISKISHILVTGLTFDVLYVILLVHNKLRRKQGV